MRKLLLLTSVTLAVATVTMLRPPAADAQSPVFVRLEQYFESLRRHVGIPGLSAAVLVNGRLTWERGFGHADLNSSTPTSPDTPFHLGELTQAFTSVMLLECVEQGALELDELVQSYNVSAPAGASIRHTLAHIAGLVPPGSRFEYDMTQLPRLAGVVSACAGMDHRLALGNLLGRMSMRDSVPGPEWANPDASLSAAVDTATAERYRQNLARLATPYRVDRVGTATASSVSITELDGANGLIASARDLADFSATLEREFPLRGASLSAMWTPVATSGGAVTPTGLGWFVQSYNGMRVVWQFGSLPNAGGSLLVMVPERRLTLVLLANSDRLNGPYGLGDGDLTKSPFARTFLSFFL